MVGQRVLSLLLESSNVDSILYIGRRKTGVEHSILTELILSEFLNIAELKDELVGIDACIHCLGVYQKALTNVLEETSPNLTFCLFGAAGADPSEESSITFAKAKG